MPPTSVAPRVILRADVTTSPALLPTETGAFPSAGDEAGPVSTVSGPATGTWAMATAGAAASRLLRIVRAARLHKVLPLVLVVLIASLAVEGDVDWVALAACCVYVFLIITLGMHLNAITDRALDRRLGQEARWQDWAAPPPKNEADKVGHPTTPEGQPFGWKRQRK